MTQDNRSTDRRPPAGQVRPGARGDNGRARPPGPEERRGATATSGGRPDNSENMRNMLRGPGFWVTLLILLAINWLLVPLLFPEPQDRITVPYTFFKQQVTDPNASAATPTAQPQTPQTYTKFATIKPAFEDTELLPLLEQHNVVITASPLEQPRSTILTLLLSFGPTLLLLGGFLWLSSRAASAASGGMFGIGRSRARRYEAEQVAERITFDDVAGIDEVENELVEIVDFLKQPDKYQRLGGRIPKGVLLVGSPGTGKTLLARAVAGEANVPFFSM